MPNLSWNQIRQNATLFSRDWASATSEQADKQTFWNDFFLVFGIPRRTVASFEEPVRRLRGTYGFIDLLWKGKVLVEHKTAGASLEAAETQAFDYIQDLQTVGRGDEVPRYVLLSDFQRFALYDLEPDDQLDLPLFRNRFRYNRIEFPLADLAEHVRAFAFIPGYLTPTSSRPQDPLNLKAVEIMAGVHDTLKTGGYTGHDLERLLVRILFCMFADDTGIFEPDSFKLYIENRTHPDGNDLGARLAELFRTLDTDPARRQANLDEDLQAFPYINGALFSEHLEFAAFDGPMRKALLEACNFNWARISPAIFGALFQEVMKPAERRKIGAHYTSERDILKVIHPLFLDKLREEFTAIDKDRSGRRSSRLEEFRVRLTRLKLLDPACGCGNFLVIAYRELRKLELEVLRAQHAGQQAFTLDEVNRLSQVDVHQFYGIEIEEWPARIAEVALWLMDHQSNLHILEAFSQPFVRLPLRNSPHIHIGNALRMDWNDLLPAKECSYVLGNPPFIGKKEQSSVQKKEVLDCFNDQDGVGILDYVACWYIKATFYMQLNPEISCAFVSTNSITQGEQVSALWPSLLKFGVQINFAHRTFEWTSEAKGKAHVHVVILGFALHDSDSKTLFSYERRKTTTPESAIVRHINPYLVEASDVLVRRRTKPLTRETARVNYGSMPIDDGCLTYTPEQRDQLISRYPEAGKFLRLYSGGEEYINGIKRYCLWLEGKDLASAQKIPPILMRIESNRLYRKSSGRVTTQKLSQAPWRFGEIRQPSCEYLLIPKVSSESRNYIPIGYCPPQIIASGSCLIVPSANLFAMGVLSSSMHASWMRYVGGRMKSDYQYSAGLVYNNYPWPESPTDAQRVAIESAAQAVLDARALYPDSTLATLYDPDFMPPELLRGHQRLDRAVERCYRPEPFQSDRERVEFLFRLYEKLTAPLLPAAPSPRRRRATRAQ